MDVSARIAAPSFRDPTLGEENHVTSTIQQIGVVGAGTMGGGIAMAFSSAKLPVTVVDSSPEALSRCIERITKLYLGAVSRGKISEEEAKACLARISTSTDLAALSYSDLVVEAVFEDLGLKLRIAAELGAICTPAAILASNTSSLDVDVIAEASGRPRQFVGMHFFSPAHIMRLVEVIRGQATDPETIEKVVSVANALGKVPVVCGVCFGFIGNRMVEPYLREAEALVLEGATPAQVDAVAQSQSWGMAMGPCRMMDLAGLDVCASMIAARASTTNLLDDPSYRALVRALSDQGDLGQKTGKGFYRYNARDPIEEPETMALARSLAAKHGIQQRVSIPDQEIFVRLLYPLINEGFAVLTEKIARNSSDIDTVFTEGYGFPISRVGPMAMARAIGHAVIKKGLERLQRQRGNQFGYWTVSPLLVERSRSDEVIA